jgi:hypothetical protein
VVVVSAVLVIGTLGAPAWAGSNAEDGDTDGSSDQSVESHSGDAVAGQVGGITSSGRTTLNATNVSSGVSVASGDADGTVSASGFAGLDVSTGTAVSAAAVGGPGSNIQSGDDSFSVTQSLTVASGDAVGGQVVGIVTSAGGTTDVVAANTSTDVDVESGDVLGDADAAGFAGLNASASSTSVVAADAATATNVQEGDDDVSITQTADLASGDGVAGQVIGVVSAGTTSIDATNRSEDVDIESGEVIGDQDTAAFAGLNASSGVSSVFADIRGFATATNIQEGDDSVSLTQDATASTGDGIGGQVIGAVTSAGGANDIVAANTSHDVDVETGEADSDQDSASFAGLNASESDISIAAAGSAIVNSTATNILHGDAASSVEQSSDLGTGEGVGGQVIGSVSAGDSSIDATNSSDDVDIGTGDAEADAAHASFVGLNASSASSIVSAAGNSITNANGVNIQLEGSLSGGDLLEATQSVKANTGDGVGGQVLGVVTSAGGSTDLVAANTSQDVDADTGDATSGASESAFVGLNASTDTLEVAAAGRFLTGASATNVQLGDNELTSAQSAEATTGDAVGGQVLGVVSAGDTSLDATNASREVDVDSGDSDADNSDAAFVGLNVSSPTTVGAAGTAIVASTAANLQSGDNSFAVNQSAVSGSGDAVAGQVQGVVTDPSGVVDAVISNRTEDTDAESGDDTASADDSFFGGLSILATIDVF